MRELFERLAAATAAEDIKLAPAELEEAQQAARAVLGPPPLIMGNDPTLRWRRGPMTILMSLDPRRPGVQVRGTDELENQEYFWFRNGMGRYECDEVYPWLWSRNGAAGLDGMMFPGQTVFDGTWEEFGSDLGDLLAGLARTVLTTQPDLYGVVWVLAPEEPDKCAQGILSFEQGTYAEVCEDDVEEHWEKHELGPLCEDAARRSAQVAMAAFERWKLPAPSALKQRFFVQGGGGRLDVHMLGLHSLDR